MSEFFETKNFIVESHPKPFVSRADGGHIRIRVKDQTISDRTKLAPSQAIELIRLTMVVGEALEKGMNDQGIPVVKINYEELGNWAYKPGGGHPFLHIHIFGRSRSAVHQPFPEAVSLPDRSTGFYDNFESLTLKDEEIILGYIKSLMAQDRYQDSQWKL
jgi:diadenosine tetraphosphate (Ap4A) HIT family hydrolase